MDRKIIILIATFCCFASVAYFQCLTFKSDFTNCEIFHCINDSNCKANTQCLNNRCTSIRRVRCEKNGTIYAGNPQRDVYYTPLPIENLNWTNAKAKCESIGAKLLTIRDNEEYEFLRLILRSFSKLHCSWCYDNDFHRWIGAYSSLDNPDAYWLDGRLANQSLFETSNGSCYLWDMSDPDLSKPFKGSKDFCSSTQPYICKFNRAS